MNRRSFLGSIIGGAIAATAAPLLALNQTTPDASNIIVGKWQLDVKDEMGRVKKTYSGTNGICQVAHHMDAFIPERWAADSLQILQEEMIIGRIVFRDFDGQKTV